MNRSVTPSSPDDVYTVSELTRKIKRLLERNWAAVWVEGELSNVKLHASGHLYFTLKDDRAALRGVMFRSNASRLRFEVQDGQKMRVFGSLTVYEPQGSYQVSATRMEPVGVGELEIAFRQMYERLEREGLFDAARKRPIPAHARTIGIVTSESGAAIRDLFSVLGRRAPWVDLVVRPARVQGQGAAQDLTRALQELDAWGGCDVVILGRGGGSLEDLWAFNDEVLARAIRASAVPVISAVGHEVDFTISDFAADLRAATPSAAAELAVPDRTATRSEVIDLGRRLGGGITRFLRERRERVMLLGASPAFRDPMEFYRRRSQDVDRLAERMESSIRRLLERCRLLEAGVRGRLVALSPLAILERGYAIVQDRSGAVVRGAADVARGDAVEVRLGAGQLGCTVDEVRDARTEDV